jgi:hypothetical protein
MTFTASVLQQSAADGTIRWEFAAAIAALHGLTSEFLGEYAALIDESVDAGELLVWLGY